MGDAKEMTKYTKVSVLCAINMLSFKFRTYKFHLLEHSFTGYFNTIYIPVGMTDKVVFHTYYRYTLSPPPFSESNISHLSQILH